MPPLCRVEPAAARPDSRHRESFSAHQGLPPPLLPLQRCQHHRRRHPLAHRLHQPRLPRLLTLHLLPRRCSLPRHPRRLHWLESAAEAQYQVWALSPGRTSNLRIESSSLAMLLAQAALYAARPYLFRRWRRFASRSGCTTSWAASRCWRGAGWGRRSAPAAFLASLHLHRHGLGRSRPSPLGAAAVCCSAPHA